MNEIRFDGLSAPVDGGALFNPAGLIEQPFRSTPRQPPTSLLHERAKRVFLLALGQPAGEQEVFVREACGGDEALREEVESLLGFHEEGEVSDSPKPEWFEAGDVLANRYRMVMRIGRGGMADVWQADDLLLGTPVALKLIHSRSAEARRHVINEVRLARQITHPAVCRVFDVGETGDIVFYSMELVREDLKALLKRVGRLPSEKVIDIAHQLCAGLAAAHAKDVLHRDLKPANVLIDDAGLVRIADFGIAVTRAEAEHPLAGGTPDYMAPEQMKTGAPLSEQTDLFALGVVLYELVTGQHPFKRAAGSRQLLKPSALVPDVNPQLDRILMKALAPRAADRPASAAAFAAGLPKTRSAAVPTIAGAGLARRMSRPWILEPRLWSRCLCW